MTRREPQREHAAVLRRQSDGSIWQADVVVAINVGQEWQITDHPVEQGVVVTDHVQVQPTEITITCVVSENPIRAGGGTVGGQVRLQERMRWLRETADEAELVDIVTRRMGVFTGYAIRSVPYVLDRVSRLRFDLQLRQLRVATATTVLITVDQVADDVATGAPDEVDTGEQATTSTDTDEQAEAADQSTLASLLDALG
jgi:hypothetical protein